MSNIKQICLIHQVLSDSKGKLPKQCEGCQVIQLDMNKFGKNNEQQIVEEIEGFSILNSEYDVEVINSDEKNIKQKYEQLKTIFQEEKDYPIIKFYELQTIKANNNKLFILYQHERLQYDLLKIKQLNLSFFHKLEILFQALKGLQLIRSKGIILDDLNEESIQFSIKNNQILVKIGLVTSKVQQQKYQAPELQQKQVCIGSDIYNFGMIMKNIFNLDEPQLFEDYNLFLEHCNLTELSNKCVFNNPDSRISIELLMSELKKIQQSLKFQLSDYFDSNLKLQENEELNNLIQQSDKIKQYMKENQFKIFRSSEQNLSYLEKFSIDIQAFFKLSLMYGFNNFNNYIKQIPSNDISLNYFFEISCKLIDVINQTSCLGQEQLLEISKKIINLYDILYHIKEMEDIGRIVFCEFFIGLHLVFRFIAILNCHLFLNSHTFDEKNKKILRQHLLQIELYKNNYWESLLECKRVILFIWLIEQIGQRLTIEESEFQWNNFKEVLHNNYGLNGAFQLMCSLRYVPQQYDRKIHITLAQILHWKGFGGDAEFLPDENDPYIKELIDFQELALRYHKKDKINWGGSNALENSIFPILIPAKKDFERYIIKFAQFTQKQGNEDKIINVIDLGSGPLVPAVESLSNDKTLKLNIVATDIDPQTIIKLCHNKRAAEIMFCDLNYIDQYTSIRQDLNFTDKFDLITVNVVLHHCADLENYSFYANLFRFLSDIAMVGGSFALMDGGPLMYMEGPVMPLNLMDREGCISNNIYYLIKDLKSMAWKEGDEYKIMLLIPNSVSVSPKCYSLYGGFFLFNAYINCSLNEDKMNELQNTLDTKQERDLFALFEEIIQNQVPELWKELKDIYE